VSDEGIRPDLADTGSVTFLRQLATIAGDVAREERVQELTASAHDHGNALSAASLFELDDVIDPADTRRVVAATLAAAKPAMSAGARSRFVDTW
jgi:acetyl-CoA carboxylase carboxyltransferase component